MSKKLSPRIRKKILKSKSKVFYNPLRRGWCITVEEMLKEDCPLLFSDKWINSVIPSQQKILLKELKEYSL